MARRAELRRVVLAVMDEQRVSALAYPTMRREPARIGESQGGTNCQLSPAIGFPALVLPAAFTDGGLPVGLELLGRPFREADLLGLGYAFEQVTRVRRPPPTTPSLPVETASSTETFVVRSARPGPEEAEGVAARFQWDETRAVLSYYVAVDSVGPADVLLVALRHGQSGAIVARLLRTGQARSIGEVTLGEPEREALIAGNLVAQLFTRQQPLGGPSLAVEIESRPTR